MFEIFYNKGTNWEKIIHWYVDINYKIEKLMLLEILVHRSNYFK